MSVSESSTTEVLPSYNTLREAQQLVLPSPAFFRLFWTLSGPLSTAISVMEEAKNTDSPREAYFRQALTGTTWHPVADEPFSEPKVSSISVEVYHLWQWLWEWTCCHEQHADPDDEENCVYGEVDDVLEGEEPGPRLVKCCGTDRPSETLPLLVTASGKPYVTVHDYVSAVHPWLMGLRDKILLAKNVWNISPLPADTKLMVEYTLLRSLLIQDEKSWVENMKRLIKPTPVFDMDLTPAFEAFMADPSTILPLPE